VIEPRLLVLRGSHSHAWVSRWSFGALVAVALAGTRPAAAANPRRLVRRSGGLRLGLGARCFVGGGRVSPERSWPTLCRRHRAGHRGAARADPPVRVVGEHRPHSGPGQRVPGATDGVDRGTSAEVPLTVSLGQRDEPYAQAWPATVASIAPGAPVLVKFEGTAEDVVGSTDNPLILKIQLGAGPAAGYTLCIDDVDLDNPAHPTTVPSGVFVNQLGYPTRGHKVATTSTASRPTK